MISGEYPPLQGGVGDYTALMAKHLRALDVDVSVATAGSAAASGGDVDVWRSDRGWGYRRLSDLGRRAADWGADVLHVQYQAAAYQMHPAVNLACWLLRRHAGRRPIVVTLHDWNPPYLFPKAAKLRQFSLGFLAATADAVIVTNAEDARCLRAHPLGARSKNTVIPIGSNIAPLGESPASRNAWRRSLGVGEGEFLLSYFGFLNENKGVDLLLKAAAKLLEHGRPIRVLLIGGTAGDSDPTNRSYESTVRVLAGEPSLRDKVIWTGFAANQIVSRHLSASDLCVLPFRSGASFRHGSLVAAVAHGLPLVTTTPPNGATMAAERGLRPLVDGENALLVGADVDSLCRAIGQLIDAPDALLHLASGASALAQQFAWPAIATSTLRLYESLLNTRERVQSPLPRTRGRGLG